MKTFINSLFISLSMYSIIPTPPTVWEKNNMKYVMAFMPLVGLITGFILKYFIIFSDSIGLNSLLFAAIATIIPIVISGGLHLDGFIDTADALSSHKDMETKLQILKDSHTGAFAIIYCVCYFVLFIGIWSQYRENIVFVSSLPLLLCLSRGLSAFFVVTLKPARQSGLVYMFNDSADKKWSSNALILEIILLFLLLLRLDLVLFLFTSALTLVLSLGFILFEKRLFGGITGDLIGFFISTAELFMIFMLAVLSMR